MEDKTQTSLKDSFLSKLENEHVRPRSKLFFQCRECSMWLFWVISVVIGALAVAVSLFVITQRQYSLYEATHENFYTFMVEVLPVLWFVMFVVMVAAAWYNFRHTKRGYRYSFLTVIISSMVVSFAGGAALQLFGFGYAADTMLGKQMDMYMSQEKLEEKMWQQPEEGRLVGVCEGEIGHASSSLVFIDAHGDSWDMDVSDLYPADTELLQTQQTVRVLGAVSGTSTKLFHACGVFPWMMSKDVTMRDLSREREDFIHKVYSQKSRAEERLVLLETVTFANPEDRADQDIGVCAELAAVRRIEQKMP